MKWDDRACLRRTCKQLYYMFLKNVPAEKIQEWKTKIVSLMGLALSEKLVVSQKLSFTYRIKNTNGISWNYRTGYKKEHITFILDANEPKNDNVRFCFLFQSPNPLIQSYDGKLITTNRFFSDTESDTVSTLFKLKDIPLDVLNSENVDYLNQVLADMFFKFASRPQYKSYLNMQTSRIAKLMQDILDRPNNVKNEIFQMFDNSNFVEQDQNQSTENRIYQEKANQMVDDLRKEMKPYFFDGEETKFTRL